MSTLEIRVDVSGALRGLSGPVLKQARYAQKQAINTTVVQAQRAVLQHIDRTYDVRRPSFAALSVKVLQFATLDIPTARIGIAGPVGQPDRANIYGQHEDGGLKTPYGGGHLLAVPRPGSFVKRSTRSIVPADLRPNALRSNPAIRTFVRAFKGGGGKLGIFGVRRLDEAVHEANARTGRRSSAAQTRRATPELLYTLIRSAPIAPDLDFGPIVTNTVQSGFGPNFSAAFVSALQSA